MKGMSNQGSAKSKIGKILQHTSTDPKKRGGTAKGNQGFMADGQLKPHSVSSRATGIMKSGGGRRGMKY